MYFNEVLEGLECGKKYYLPSWQRYSYLYLTHDGIICRKTKEDEGKIYVVPKSEKEDTGWFEVDI